MTTDIRKDTLSGTTPPATSMNTEQIWRVSQDKFDPMQLHVDETIYTIGNGYFGTRGTFEEGYPGSNPATLLYGVFDSIPIGKEELANAPDWLTIKLFVNDGERFRLDHGELLAFHRSLDLLNGVLTRIVRWKSRSGVQLLVKFERFASLANGHVGAIRMSVTPESLPQEQSANTTEIDIDFWAAIDTAVGNNGLMHWESMDANREGEIMWLDSRTRHTHIQLVQTMSFTCDTPGLLKEFIDSDISPSIRFSGKLAMGQTLTAEKIVVMYTSRDVEDPCKAALQLHHQLLDEKVTLDQLNGQKQQSRETVTQITTRMQESAYARLLVPHTKCWHDYWDLSDIIIEGDGKAQEAMRYNLYQLRLSVSPTDSYYSIPAKGLTGFGYLGHIFHDTEIFMLPYFSYVHPHIARNLLLYRYHLLPAAREKAKQNGFSGAQFPWESTMNGEEATPVSIIHPETGEVIPVLNGFIELHISASIAYAVWQYWVVTGDDEFMRDYGAELFLSTAEFWASRAQRNPIQHDYVINNVIGPDEWHEHVNNNAYTNYMARWNIQQAFDVLQWLEKTEPEKAEELTQHLDLTSARLEQWQDVADHLRIPQEPNGLFEQFDHFFQLKPLDQEKDKGRKDSYQALLGIKKVQEYQIVKQADVLMLMTLQRAQFDLRTKQVNWNYYFPITDHDYGSSLTPALHVILACQLGYVDLAYNFFMKGALTDLENLRLNTASGIHDASCGAVWQAAVLGFAGLQLTEEGYTTDPCWPDGWTRLAFHFFHKGKLNFVDLRRS